MTERKDQPVRLGVTGGAGSGKSVVCERLGGHGVRVILADELARRAVMPGMPAYENIIGHFGRDILEADGSINRAKLRRVILKDQEKKQALESFVHPEVFRLMAEDYQAAAENGAALVAVEVPLLFEAGLEGYFDYILTVSVEREVRIQRLMARDRISREDAESLIRAQMPEEEKQNRSHYVIDNSGPLAETNKTVDRFYQEFLERLKIF
ncbi:MAG: dephospho-CoA kinase [Desulfobacterales bacterium]|nr:dephospho-CoA kinase [Desulfobacterales bacterium]